MPQPQTKQQHQDADAQNTQQDRAQTGTDGAMLDAAASGSFADGQQATQPKAELGDGPIPGENAWLLDAMKFNRLQHYTPSQWKAIQQFVKTEDDGIPGKGTARGVYRWQQSKGMQADGMIGSATYEALQADSAPIPKAIPIRVEQTAEIADSQKPAANADGQPKPEEQASQGKRNPTMETDKNKFLAVIDQITSVMETGESEGKYDMLHTLNDGGGISYGKHQVTLTSGTLTKLLDTYLELASKESANAKTIRGYLARVRRQDLTLRAEKTFLSALRSAAAEKEMVRAQDIVFLGHYGKPAWDAAKTGKITSVLGHAILYDTKIQGGMESLLASTKKKLGGAIGEEVDGEKIDERRFLSVFNDLREARLKRLAVQAKNRGEARRAQMLRNSAYRTEAFRELLQAGNLNVAGPDGNVKIKGPGGDKFQIHGFDTKDVEGAKTGLEGIKTIGRAMIDAERLSVRSAAKRDADRIETVDKGDEFDVVEQRDGWLKIKLASKLGWISADYADFSPAQEQEQEQ